MSYGKAVDHAHFDKMTPWCSGPGVRRLVNHVEWRKCEHRGQQIWWATVKRFKEGKWAHSTEFKEQYSVNSCEQSF